MEEYAGRAKHFVFLSHNSADKPAVEEIARRLDAEGIEPWLDAWHLVPGAKWQPALEKALQDAQASVVFVGPSGVGPWQDEEMRVAIDLRVRDPAYRVVPVLLPGALRGKRSAVPAFLANVTWVEFHHSLDEEAAFRRLLAGIRGLPPGMPPKGNAEGVNPYRGLKAFDVADHELFFGREALTGWLMSDIRSSVARRGEMRLLAVVGASGSGKSSLARAGVLAQLAQGAIEGSAAWPQLVFKPGADPLEALALAGADSLGLGGELNAVLKFCDDLAQDSRSLHIQSALALRGSPGGTHLLILVDQFEEVFTLCPDENRRRAFIDNLLYAAAVADGPCIVVLTLRADFIGHCATHPHLAATLSGQQQLVGPMSREELREAIECPAWSTSCEFEPGLVETLLDDVEAQPGALPLLQHALFELWRLRQGRHLTHDAYLKIGRVEGALAKRADELYRRFSDEERAATKRILLRLTQPGEGTEDTRKRATRAEIQPTADSSAVVDRVITVLTDERLLVTEGETVDVAHEALIRSWPQLREWIEQDREGLREHRRLTQASNEWQRLDRDDSLLYRGLKLDQALAWRARNETTLNPLEREFLDACARLRDSEKKRLVDLAERELTQARQLAKEMEARRAAEAERAQQQRKLTRIAALIALVAIVLGLATGGLWLRSEEERNIAEVTRLAAESRSESDQRLDLSLLLAIGAVDTRMTGESREILFSNLQMYDKLITHHTSEFDYISHLAVSPEGKTLAAAGYYDPPKQREQNGVLSDHVNHVVMLWDVATRTALPPLVSTEEMFVQLAFSPDGKILASMGDDGTVMLWDLATRKALPPLVGTQNEGNLLAFSPDGKILATASSGHTVRLWDLAKRKALGMPLVGHLNRVRQITFSPDGKILASVSIDSEVIFWDVATRKA